MPGMVSLIAAVLVAHIMSVSCSEETINPDVVKAANFAIEFHNRMTNYPYAYKVVDILSNSVQIYPPSRVKFSIKVRAAQTTCRNNGSMNLEDCSIKANAQMMICIFDVLAVPGENVVPEYVLLQHCV
ncbi:cystatin-F [Silurus meridionalis]|nr:cystatin-F [Silurus meridionalis]XP_046714186.1 cystatin-F [Silurus meridionalis]